MRLAHFTIVTTMIICSLAAGWQAQAASTLIEARKAFKTKIVRQDSPKVPVETAPAAIFRTIRFDSPVGKLAAYLTPDPKDGKKYPAIIWITGGDSNTIGDVWNDAPASNDQTAAQYRKLGIVMMFPSLRGGNDNPGLKEAFLGEVDDIVAAADYLRTLPYVDPERVYLGGHSTGGTLVLLTAASTDTFRAVFSFGPVDVITNQNPRWFTFDPANPRELELRSPIRWLSSINVPVFAIEGTEGGGKYPSLQAMQRASTNPKVKFLAARGANHFNVLAPANQLIAEKILRDTGAESNLTITEEEIRARLAN